MTSNRTGGTFTLTFNGQTTAALNASNATAVQVRTALRDLNNLGTFDVVVTGGPLPADINVEFVGQTVYGQNLPNLTATDNGTGGTALTVAPTDGANTSDFDFPQFEGTASGVPLAVDLEPAGTVSGNYNAATGALSTTRAELLVDDRPRAARRRDLRADADPAGIRDG